MDPIFQFTDLSTHVQNCSNDECILPTCVNWKLNIAKNCPKQPQQHSKRERNTIASDARRKKEKLQDDKELDETTALFFEDLEELMKGDLGKRRPSCLATEANTKNSFHVSQNNPGCNELHINVDNDVNLTLNSQQNKSDEFAQSPSDKLAVVAQGISPFESTARSLKTEFFPLETGKFIPIDDFSYRRPSSMTTATTATTKATETLPFFCTLKDNKLPHEDDSKLKEQARIIEPTNAKRLWGILAKILQMIEEEGSVSEDSEAFCVQVLQKALAELQFRFFPPK